MSLLILIFVVGVLFPLHSIGFLPNLSISWEFVWRLFLNILLVLGVIGLFLKIWSIVVILAHLDTRLLVSPSRDPFIDITSTAILALALYGIWRRRKWGAYLVFARLAFTNWRTGFIYHSLNWQLARNYAGLQNVFADLIGAVMWLCAFSRTWAYFTRKVGAPYLSHVRIVDMKLWLHTLQYAPGTRSSGRKSVPFMMRFRSMRNKTCRRHRVMALSLPLPRP